MEDKAKIWFFTDIHGSNACFKKFLNLPKNENKPNVLIIGADITGKTIIPIVESNNGVRVVPLGGKEVKIRPNEVSTLKEKLSDIGFYPCEFSEHEYRQFIQDKQKQREVFDRLVKERLEEWVKWADAKLPSSDECIVIINAGNDDPMYVDAILDTSKKIIRPEEKVIDLPAGLKLLSTGYSTPTPWNCPRDISEEDMKTKIASMTSQVNGNDKLIFNFHCPPKNSSLDLANKIDTKTLIKQTGLGKNPTISAGAQSIREAIELWKPIASLHGHIHEVHAKEMIGKTACFNPGTDYSNGRLQGVFLQINKDGIIEYDVLTQERQSAKLEGEEDNVLSTIISSIPLIGTIYKNYTSSKKSKETDKTLKQIKDDINEIKNNLNGK